VFLGNNIIKRTPFNLSLNHLYKKSVNEDLSKNNLHEFDDDNSNVYLMKKKSEFDFKNFCSPSETKKMHNILFEFMNLKKLQKFISKYLQTKNFN